jgi:hypothetical protein
MPAIISLCATAAVAQPAAKATGEPIPALPAKLSGVLETRTTEGKPVADGLEVQIKSQEPDGRVVALFTRHVRYSNPHQQCMRAREVPADGTYDGRKLILNIRYSQSLAVCNDATWTFFRGTKEHYFFTRATDGRWSMYLDPMQ